MGGTNDGIVVGIEDVVLMHLSRFLAPLSQDVRSSCDDDRENEHQSVIEHLKRPTKASSLPHIHHDRKATRGMMHST